jgi:hypothetical protein
LVDDVVVIEPVECRRQVLNDGLGDDLAGV